MAILKVKATANGVVGAWLIHELRLVNGAETCQLVLHGYATEEQANTKSGLLWEEYVPVRAETILSGDTWVNDLEHALVEPGEAFAGGVVVTDAPQGDLEKVKEVKWSDLKRMREKVISSGFTVPGLGSFNSDMQSRIDIIGAGAAVLAAQAMGQSYSTEFTTLDNRAVTLHEPQIMALGMGLGAHLDAIHRHTRGLRKLLTAATTVEEVGEIDWDSTPMEETAEPVPAPEEPAPAGETPESGNTTTDETVDPV